MMFRTFLCILTFVTLQLSAKALSHEVANVVANEEPKKYGLAQVVAVQDGYFGAKRVYYSLKCNEVFVSYLTEDAQNNSLSVGVLKEILPQNCNGPARQEWVRITPEGRRVVPAEIFAEVWKCNGVCYIISDPAEDPHKKVTKFGTSEEQTRDRLPCPAEDQINMVCRQIEVETARH
jgi:hypothetical protein